MYIIEPSVTNMCTKFQANIFIFLPCNGPKTEKWYLSHF